MVLLTQGINRYRDLIYNDLNEGILGSDGTEVYVTDTTIGAAIAGTTHTVTATKFNKGFKIDFITDVGDGDGYSAREFVVTDANDDVNIRATFPEIVIGPTTQISITSQIIFLQEF